MNQNAQQQVSHAPGPWHAASSFSPDRETFSVRQSAGQRVALAYTPEDAHLIAAAPELLEALEDTERDLQAIANHPDSSHSMALNELRKRLRAAIRKARGSDA